MMNRQQKIIWAAGFIDGEGTVGVGCHDPTTRLRHQLHLRAYQAIIDPLLILSELWGGNITYMPSRSLTRAPQFRWGLSGKIAGRALREMAPFLCNKAKHAALASQYLELGGGRGIARSVREQRAAIKQAFHQLNVRGAERGVNKIQGRSRPKKGVQLRLVS